jgi:predicted DNA-binding transcriptional regulator AlpA
MRKLITKHAAAEAVSLHPETVMRLVREGRFPTPIKLGRGSAASPVRFDEAEIDAWLEGRFAAREPAAEAAA